MCIKKDNSETTEDNAKGNTKANEDIEIKTYEVRIKSHDIISISAEISVLSMPV